MKVVLCVVTLAASSAAMGGVSQEIVQTRELTIPISAGESFFSFDLFDDLGGGRTLQEVVLSFDASLSADVTAENEASVPAEGFQLVLDGMFEVTLEDELAASDTTSDSFFASLGASDGVPDSGDDFVDFGVVTLPLMASESASSDLSGFIGSGEISGVATTFGEFGFSGTTGASLTIEGFQVVGDVTLTYRYVPAPGAAGLLGLGALATARRRRRDPSVGS